MFELYGVSAQFPASAVRMRRGYYLLGTQEIFRRAQEYRNMFLKSTV